MLTLGHPRRCTCLLWVLLLLLTGCTPRLRVCVESYRNQPPPGDGTRFAFIAEGDFETVELVELASATAVGEWVADVGFTLDESRPAFVDHPLPAAAHAAVVAEMTRRFESAGWIVDAEAPDVLIAIESRRGTFYFCRRRQVIREQEPRTVHLDTYRGHKGEDGDKGGGRRSVTVFDQRTTIIPAGPGSGSGVAVAVSAYLLRSASPRQGDDAPELWPLWQGVIVGLDERALSWERWGAAVLEELLGEWFAPGGRPRERWLKLPD